MPKYQKRADGRYRTSVTTNVLDSSGKKKRIYVYESSVAELERNKAAALTDIEKGFFVFHKDVLFRDYKWKWLELYKSDRETNTLEGYKNILKNHTFTLDNLRLVDIKKSHVQMGYNALSGHADFQRRYYQTVNQMSFV